MVTAVTVSNTTIFAAKLRLFFKILLMRLTISHDVSVRLWDMYQRWVLHIDMDAFFASVEQLTRPTLRGRPVLVGGTSGRGVVAGASYEARRFGAHSAMPMHQARALVGFAAITVQPRIGLYRVASRRVFDLVTRNVGTIEQISVDEAFLEPTGLRGATPDDVATWANNLRTQIRQETGLPSSIGVGPGKQSAKIASSMAKPNGLYIIPKDQEADILGPLPVRKLWGVGPVSEIKLQRMGVKTIADLANLPQTEVEASLGKTVGLGRWHRARGIDTAPVEPRAEAKSVGAEYTYPHDLTTRPEVDAAIDRAFEAALRRLRTDGRGARTVNVKLKLADFHTLTRAQSFPYAIDDPAILRNATNLLVRYPHEVGPIRLVGVSFSNLDHPSQEMLFPDLHPTTPATAPTDSVDWETGVRGNNSPDEDATNPATNPITTDGWYPTQDVTHPDHGHGWIQGIGHGKLTVRFETRTTPRGHTRTFATTNPDLQPADPLTSLDWDDWLAEHQ